MDYAIQLLIPLMLGLYAGHWLDQKTHREPLFTLIGMICGMLLGFGILYKRVIMIQQQQAEERKAKKAQEEKDQHG